ncbi:MAG: 16S rRNA (cytidine(1402)-2'-O)-methyltransferase [Actinomycetes bacterium]
MSELVTSDRGVIVLAATPIGNPADGSARLCALIGTADVIAAEDTRRFRRLAVDLGVAPTGRVVSFFESAEKSRIPQLLAAAAGGQTVLVVTDAGMPSVSDPGYRLVVAAVDAGIAVTVAPGPSAVTAALAVSGLPSDRFCFEGFLPRKAGERGRRLADLDGERRTMVFFEAPHRIGATMAALAQAFGDARSAVVCRELTKTYEEVKRGTLGDLALWSAEGLRGEITIVVAGADPAVVNADPAHLAQQVNDLMEQGTDKKAAIAAVARRAGVAKRLVYNAVLESASTP